MENSDLVQETVDVEKAIADLAARYTAAGNFGVQVLNVLNWPAESLIERLPENARAKLETATVRGLEAAMSAASGTRSLIKDQKNWVNTATTTAVGVVGGLGGLTTALAELPVTVTMLMRSVQAVAAEHGFDPDEEQTRKDALLVFAAAGPLVQGKTPDLTFLSSRVTLTGVNVYVGIGLIAPRLALVLGRKLAAQTIPVIGAATAAATNYSYSGYYQEMAAVVFGLRALSEQTGTPFEELVEMLSARLED
ncbi:EcsC family protein [Pacificoceanicola onchidii]|uniref:EcsC family protein n=1 Tax=Pacificoceanicola onchidii TaxID=2562685 RepID=UPI0010A57486|nr:EcsC family protein [Pacificoceanicola onchidii]